MSANANLPVPSAPLPVAGFKDIYDISAVEKAGIGNLQEGQKLSFEVLPGKQGKSSAENLRAV